MFLLLIRFIPLSDELAYLDMMYTDGYNYIKSLHYKVDIYEGYL